MSERFPDIFPRNWVKHPHFEEYLKNMVEPSLSEGLQRGFEMRDAMDELTVMTFITGLTSDLATDAHNSGVGFFGAKLVIGLIDIKVFYARFFVFICFVWLLP
jgi:hypothetical protein